MTFRNGSHNNKLPREAQEDFSKGQKGLKFTQKMIIGFDIGYERALKRCSIAAPS